MKIEIQRTVEVDDLFAQDILITAVEGGSVYWLNEDDITDVELVRYPRAKNAEGYYYKALKFIANGEDYEVTEAKIWETLTEIALHQHHKEGSEYVKHFSPHENHLDAITKALNDNDLCQIDADLADIVIQLTCFGKLVYG